jgi:hypothetical protein
MSPASVVFTGALSSYGLQTGLKIKIKINFNDLPEVRLFFGGLCVLPSEHTGHANMIDDKAPVELILKIQVPHMGILKVCHTLPFFSVLNPTHIAEYACMFFGN